MNLSTIEAFKHLRTEDMVVLTKEQLSRLQDTLNSMMDDIISLCERYDIAYQLGGGTALGAVRHGGFIPWDDDVDLNMPRKDHDRFVKLFRREYGERYWVHTATDSENYGLLLSRVLLKGTSVRTREDFWNDECGAFIDIFIIENTFDNRVLRTLHGYACLGFGFAQSCRKFYRDRVQLMKLLNPQDKDSDYRKAFLTKIRIGRVLSFGSMDWWTHVTQRVYTMCKNEHSKYVSVPSGKGHFFGELYLREDLCSISDFMYDGKLRHVPGNYDLYLRRLYGDYMKIPDPDKLEHHVFFPPFDLGDSSKDN